MTIKPGWTTSEWWTTLITNAVAIVALLHPGFTAAAWVAPLAAAGAALATAAYSYSRGTVKAAAVTPPAVAAVPTVAADLAKALQTAAGALVPPTA